MQIAVIVPAAGASRRYSVAHSVQTGSAPETAPRSKLDEDLGGRPVLHRTLEVFANLPQVIKIIVPGPADPEAMAAFRARHADKLGILGAVICAGGVEHRYESVRNALAHVPANATHVAVHDAARPGASPELIERVFSAAERHDAVIPALDVSDTLKRVSAEALPAPVDPLAAILGVGIGGGGGGGGSGSAALPRERTVRETVDRAHLVAVQTPQVFRAEVLRRAYQQKDLSSTDDAQLVERLGVPVVVVAGEKRNLKVTLPEDLTLIRAMLGYKGGGEKPAHLRF